jgi:hypothetical protein
MGSVSTPSSAMPTAPSWWYVLRSNGRGDWHCCPLGPLALRTKQEDDIGRRGWGGLAAAAQSWVPSFYASIHPSAWKGCSRNFAKEG